MKKQVTIILATVILLLAGPVSASTTGQQGDQDSKKDKNGDSRELTVGRRFLKITENDSSVHVRIGNRGLSILESLEGEKSEIRIERYSPDSETYSWNDDDDSETRRGSKLFKGSWAGIEFGFNNYTAANTSHYIPADIAYMDLHSGKSNNFNLNFAQLSLGLSRHVGFVTGLGLNWNNYRFDGNNNIVEGEDGIITELDPGSELEKSKLTTLFATAPFLLEIQIPVRYNHFNIAAGPIGAVKIASHSKMVFEGREKIKSNDDFNLNMLRLGLTARAGYSNFQVYGTYYLTSMFREGRSPGGYILHPFEVGIALTFND